MSSTQIDINSTEGLQRELIPKTGITTQWFLQKMADNCMEFKILVQDFKIAKIECKDIAGDRGYASYIHRVIVTFENGKEFRSVIKVPNVERLQVFYKYADSEQQQQSPQLVEFMNQIYSTECDAYKLLECVQDSFPLPHVYYTQKYTNKQCALIVMEDLTERGVPMELHEGASRELCLNFVRHFVEFQVRCENDVTQSDGSQTKRFEFPHGYHVDEQNTRHTWPKMIQQTIDGVDGDLKSNFAKFLSIDLYALSLYAHLELPKEYNALTLCHADTWSNNMMLKKECSDEFAAICDWQALFEANPLYDVARFMTNCADADVRRELDSLIVDFYHKTLIERCRQLGKKSRFSLKAAHHMYKVAFVIQAPILAITLGLRGFPLKESKIESDMEKYEKIHKRIACVMEDLLKVEKELGLFERFKL